MRLPFIDLAAALVLSWGVATGQGSQALAGVAATSEAPADGPAARLFIIGAGTDPVAAGTGLEQVVMDGLPVAGQARSAVVAAILHERAAASFAAATGDTPGMPDGGRAGALFLRIEALAGPGAEARLAGKDISGAGGAAAGVTTAGTAGIEETDAGAADGDIGLTVGDTVMDMPEFGRRLGALTDAVAPEARPLLYLRITDPDDRLASHVTELQKAAAGASFALIVATTGEADAACAPALSPDLALAAGLPDRVPFGDGNGETSMAEAVAWLESALARPGRHRPECTTAHVLILHDGAQAMNPIMQAPFAALPPDLEGQLARESLEAHVMAATEEPDTIDAWLAGCVLCPGGDALATRAGALREEMQTRTIEARLWNEVAGDTTPERIRAWLATCRICAERDRAEGRLAALEVEGTALDAALAANDPEALDTWLADCIRCERRTEAEAAAESLRRAAALTAPCVAAAGLPQWGGPRQLEDIDIATARTLCGAALAQSPDDIRLRVLWARIDQADGHADKSAVAYDDGVAAELPESYGLAAYMRLFPPADATVPPDPDAAAALAQAGLERGDWLSGEVLILLYSRSMIAGHEPAEAVAIARRLAGEGDAVADFFLGYFLQNGVGTDTDDAGAVEYLTRALNAGYARAAPYLARMIEAGRGTEADPARAAALLWTALGAGDNVALDLLTVHLAERPREVIRIIQENLREAGTLGGEADGRAGPATRRAVAAYAEALSQQG